MDIVVEKLPNDANEKEWILLGDGAYKNLGYQAEVAYGEIPPTKDGEILPQGAVTDSGRGTVWVLRDGYSGYRFREI